MLDFDSEYLRDVLGYRTEVEWFTPAPAAEDAVAGPADVYLLTPDGVVTWGWTIHAVPVDTSGYRFRRFVHPDGWWILVDADEPEQIYLPAPLTLHSVSGPQGVRTVVTGTGGVPGAGDAYALARASDEGGTYRIDDAWPIDVAGAALTLWVDVYLDADVTFDFRPASPDERSAIADLVGVPDDPELETGELGYDEETADALGAGDDLFWFQGDLTWPDSDDDEAFRDRIDVRTREGDGTDRWLVSVEPLEDSDEPVRRLPDGGLMRLDPEDPTVIRLAWDRTVLAVSRQTTGYEPAGVAVPIGKAPTAEQWEELRRVLDEHDDCVLIHAPAWGEQRVDAALAEWAAAWTGGSPRFVHDFDDPVGQAAIDANNALETAEPPAVTVRTATRPTCMYTEPVISDFEEPVPCGRPAFAYYRDGDEMVLVCEDHAPEDEKLSTLMQA